MELLCAPLKASREHAVGFSWPPAWDGQSAALPIDEFLISRHSVPWMGGPRTSPERRAPTRSSITWALIPATRSRTHTPMFSARCRLGLTLVRLYAVIERARRRGSSSGSAAAAGDQGGRTGPGRRRLRDVVAVPLSRMLVLLRDPRDVLELLLDAQRSGGWLANARPLAAVDGESERSMGGGARGRTWMAQFRTVRNAYEAHDPALRGGFVTSVSSPTRQGSWVPSAIGLGLAPAAARHGSKRSPNGIDSVPEGG